MILTGHMVRDRLVFKGPMHIDVLIKELRLGDHRRNELICILLNLEDKGQVQSDGPMWSSDAVLN